MYQEDFRVAAVTLEKIVAWRSRKMQTAPACLRDLLMNVFFDGDSFFNAVLRLDWIMRKSKTFRTKYAYMVGVNYIFLSFDRELSSEECEELARKYFESHHQPLTLPEQTLLVDLRPVFQKPLDDVTPEIRPLD